MHYPLAISLCLLAQANIVYIPPTKAPPQGRANLVLVYNQLNNSLVIFGGYSNISYFNDLWNFNIESMLWDEIYPNSEIIPCNY